MTCTPTSPYLLQLCNRITLEEIPFSERGSRLLVFRNGSGLNIRLAERWMKWEDEVGHYRRRTPIVEGLTLTDENGIPLDFELTAYPHALCFRTRRGDFAMAFMNDESLYLKLPAAACGVKFRVFAAQGRADRRGGEFKGDPEHRRVHRNIAYTTNARILSNLVQADVNGYQSVHLQMDADAEAGLVLNVTPRLGLNRSVPRGEEVFRSAEERWDEWFARVPAVEEKYARQYYYAWWILGAGLLSSRFYLTREAMMPSMIHYVGVWAWDAFFHALAYQHQHADHELAENQLRVLLDHQREDGMIPDAVHDEGVVMRWKLPRTEREAEVTKPPLIAWTALKIAAASDRRDFLAEIYEPITRWNRWWFEKNDDDHDGIAQYNHPFSSGLDDSPLWDEDMPVESPDLNTYLVMQMDALARMAEVLELPEDAAKWSAHADALTGKIIAHFWDEAAGVFWATRDHKPIRVLTPFNLFPLLTGRLPRGMTDRLIGHLLSKEDFWTEYPIPTVARREPKYNPNQMWRGPTWVNINYLFIEGLVRSGYHDLARELRDKTLKLLMRHNDVYEYYNPETGDPPRNAASVFGWSSAVFVDLAIKASRGEII
jgi:glycogen debranching enzyme